MKFGKQIQGLALPGWSNHYLDYKALKKIINSLAHGQSSRAAQLAAGHKPTAARSFDEIGSIDGIYDVPRNLQEQKAAFFFRLERELEKVNSFYLQKEAELRVRLRSLIDKKRLLQNRAGTTGVRIGFSYLTLKEGFQHFEKDLNKLQQFIEINATGFRKILKKWDKRAKSDTKELYLSRQVEIQPCFNREVITELADKAASNLMDLENLQDGSSTSHNEEAEHVEFEKRLTFERQQDLGPASDLESDLNRAVVTGQITNVEEILNNIHALDFEDARQIVSRVVWRNIAEAQSDVLDILIKTSEFDFHYIDDINEQTILHQAAMAGKLAVVKQCVDNGCSKDRADVYGRKPLHYATMQGHQDVTQSLLQDPDDATFFDVESYTPLLYAIANGHAEVVMILLNAGVTTDPLSPTDLIPLSLACQYGHTRIVDLLLTRGAKVVRNAEGLFPLHLAAREGHAAVCKLLTDYGSDVNAVDKYSQWTPLFHAASEGHAACVKQLLAAHANIHALDENLHTAIFHAAWEGHIDCVNLLLSAGAKSEGWDLVENTSLAATGTSKLIEDSQELELDSIPTLSLPPPIIPFRIYGHNYLDKNCYVQISLGHRSAKKDVAKAPVLLYGQSRPSSLKLVIISKSHSRYRRDIGSQVSGRSFTNESVPFSIILPLADEQELFSFQISGVDALTIDFEVYPTFGSKVIGKGTALPQNFSSGKSLGRHVVPLLSQRLKTIGELAFDIEIVKPFGGVQLEIGGRVETYWKSTNVPSGQGEVNVGGGATSFVTASSLSGEYLRVVLQLTKDLVPVAYTDWTLPCSEFDVRVFDVTYDQFISLARRNKRTIGDAEITQNTAAVWQKASQDSMVGFAELLAKIPTQFGLEVELRYPTPSDQKRHAMAVVPEINTFVDAILATLYNHTQSTDSRQSRGIIFSSFSPSICTSLNWKQPNYAVFFKSYCGLSRSASADGKMLPANRVEDDRRCLSIKGAVDFAKQTHLLGIVVDSTILVQIPSLISSIKEAGLVLTTFGLANADPRCVQIQEDNGVDALVQGGVIIHRQKIDLP